MGNIRHTRHTRHPAAIASSLLSALSLLTTAGCTGAADPAEPTPPPTPPATASTPSPTPTGPATPTPPVMPDAANAHTKAGAKAFVRYFWQVVNYAQATGDTAPINSLNSSNCSACEAGVAAIDKTYEAGGHIVGGQASLSDLHAELLVAGDLRLARVSYTIRIADQRNDYPGRANDTAEPAYRGRDRLELVESPSSWLVAALVVAK